MDEARDRDHAGGVCDQELRRLWRRWCESGDLADEVTWLRARLRAGALAPERVELAAWCGHAGARAVLEELPPARLDLSLDERHPSDRPWARDLVRRAGREGAALAVAAAVRASSWWGLEGLAPPRQQSLRPAVSAIEAWLRCPCEPCLQAVGSFAAGDAGLTRVVAGVALRDDAGQFLARAISVLAMDRNGHTEPWRTQMEEAIAAALAAWALGEERPVTAGGGAP